MKLEITDLQKLQPINKDKIKKIIKSVLKVEKKDAELSVVFIDNKTIKQINNAFLGHNYATDVLSFAYNEPSFKNSIKGEIIVSVEMASKLSRRYGYEIEGEIVLYLVHGLLHLLGYDDKRKKDAKKMHQREGSLLSTLGYRDVSIPN
ncbi:MAG TPA: rRNA maturation RNase YbeY [Candidatus Brocadiaceae bacterium]